MHPLALLALLALPWPPLAAQERFGSLHRMVPLGEEGGSVVEVLDLDGDGLPEAVHGSDQLRLLRTAGDGRFVEQPGAFPATYVVSDLAVDDLNGDGFPDVVAQAAGPFPRLFAGDGAGGWVEILGAVPSTTNLLDGFTVGDLDGDGDRDLVGTRDGSVFWNDGTGRFTVGPRLMSCCDFENDVAAVDVDRDGDLDVVLASDRATNSASRVLENLGPGVFAEIVGALPTGGNQLDVEAGDLDEDGDQDLVLAGGPSVVVLNDGSGRFTEVPGVFPPGGTSGSSAQILDYDGDSHLDILQGGLSSVSLRSIDVLLGDGDGGFVARPDLVPPRTFGGAVSGIAVADVEGDGDLDVWLTVSLSSDRLLLGDGTGSLIDAQVHQPTESPGRNQGVAAGDVDGDGFEDVLFGPSAFFGPTLHLWLGDGAGGFRDGTAGLPAIPGGGIQALALGDVDQDADLDVLVSKGATHLLLNQGGGAFALAASHVPPMVTAYDLDLADLDGDGALDVVATSAGDPQQLWINDGSGIFSVLPDALVPAAPVFYPSSATLADLDGDGLPEVFATGKRDVLFQNLGGGSFVDVSLLFLPGATHGQEATFEDFDGDGDLDLFVTRIQPAFPWPLEQQNTLFLFEPELGFIDATARLPQEETLGNDVVAADFDEDGDVDLLVASTSTSGPSAFAAYYENDGSARFTLRPAAIPPGRASWLATADFDGDGDLDVFDGRSVWSNLRRQLAWRALPRIGKQLTLDLWGDPGSPWLLACSAARFQHTLAAGTLWIDPTVILLLQAGGLDASGRGSATFAMPPDPGLLGLVFPWQALFLSPPRLSSLEITVPTGG